MPTGRRIRPGLRAALGVLGSLFVLEFTFLILAAPASRAPEPLSSYSLAWVPDAHASNQWIVEARGFTTANLKRLAQAGWSGAQWQKLFSVFAEQGDVVADIGLPPMLGSHRVEGGVVRFTPQFPLQPGVSYRAVLHPGQAPGVEAWAAAVSAPFRVPARLLEPSTVVSMIYPTADELPENLLKFYVQFSAPMSGGHIYDHIQLRNESGRAVELPFLEIDEELWNPAMTRLTLFIDPGRIKRGVTPLEEIGPALEAGQRYTLAIDVAWKDATGTPLKAAFRKSFLVGAPDRTPIDPGRWKIQAPAANSAGPLVVTFDRPMDHALAQRLIWVRHGAGNSLTGSILLHERETGWTFTPAGPWSRGPHELVVQTTIEDLSGNNIGKSFEVDLFDDVERRITNAVVRLPFEVK